jgi:hypothetical protein
LFDIGIPRTKLTNKSWTSQDLIEKSSLVRPRLTLSNFIADFQKLEELFMILRQK